MVCPCPACIGAATVTGGLAAAFAAGGWAGAKTYFNKTPRTAKLGWALGMGILGYWTATGIRNFVQKRQGCGSCADCPDRGTCGCSTDKKVEVVTK